MKRIARSLAVEMALQQRAMGRRIAQLRERAHLTQEAAADKAGVTLRAYQKWEAGGGIQYANLQKLADALGTSVDEITGNDATPDPFRARGQLDRIEAKLDLLIDALGLTQPDEEDAPARFAQTFRDAAVRAHARREEQARQPEVDARASQKRRATR